MNKSPNWRDLHSSKKNRFLLGNVWSPVVWLRVPGQEGLGATPLVMEPKKHNLGLGPKDLEGLICQR